MGVGNSPTYRWGNWFCVAGEVPSVNLASIVLTALKPPGYS